MIECLPYYNLEHKLELESIYSFSERNHLLYKLLQEREPSCFISHEEMPTYEEHCAYVKSVPHPEWYFILFMECLVGSIYVSKEHEIGIFIFKAHQRKGLGRLAVLKIIKNNESACKLLANINPQNEGSIGLFKSLGFIKTQETYALDDNTK